MKWGAWLYCASVKTIKHFEDSTTMSWYPVVRRNLRIFAIPRTRRGLREHPLLDGGDGPNVLESVFHVSDFGNGTPYPLFLSWWWLLLRNTSRLCLGFLWYISFSLRFFPRQFVQGCYVQKLHHAPAFSQMWVPQRNHLFLDPRLPR